ncbi:MAG: sialate O-acetylesterase [Oscillospiraceae bacterium]|nr:sialate O-acetylesterase [Oscillospiraceae bacterium]
MRIVDGMQSAGMDMDAVLMIGQSNMAGRGELDQVKPIRNPKCFMLRNGRWQPMREPVNPDRPIFEGLSRSGVSLAASFADSYAEYFGTNVGLIPCADGGTSLSEWMPGGLLYDHAVCLTRLAQRTSELKAIIWHQGESDCARDELVESYPERFAAMLTQLRKDLGAEHVPVILGEISLDIPEKWCGGRQARLNQLLHTIPQTVPHCAVASAKDLPLKPDQLHFDAQASRILGQRYFEQYLTLIK